jgi:hypothetical protein
MARDRVDSESPLWRARVTEVTHGTGSRRFRAATWSPRVTGVTHGTGSRRFRAGGDEPTHLYPIPLTPSVGGDIPSSMTPRSVVASALILFALACVGYVAFKENATAEHRKAVQTAGRRITVYYFHGTVRCSSCNRIEAYGLEAVAGQVRAGKVVWQAVNTDRPKNAHFVQDYALLTRSIVLSETLDGRQTRWKNLDRVWELLNDKRAFTGYVQRETAAFLEDK